MWFLMPGITFINILMRFSAVVVIVFLCLPFHEFAHAWMANKLGDGTAKSMGRMTLNPLASFDLIGASCMFLFDFGWAKPVVVNPRNFKNPRRDGALVSLAGPVANMIAAIVGGLLFNILKILFVLFPYGDMRWLYMFFSYYISINIVLAAFNLLPVPPLDGFGILESILPNKFLEKYYKNYRLVSIIMMALIFFGFFNGPFELFREWLSDFVVYVTSLPFLFI